MPARLRWMVNAMTVDTVLSSLCALLALIAVTVIQETSVSAHRGRRQHYHRRCRVLTEMRPDFTSVARKRRAKCLQAIAIAMLYMKDVSKECVL